MMPSIRTVLLKIFDEKGNAMVFVIIIFFAIMILSGSMAFLFNNNLKQTKYQNT